MAIIGVNWSMVPTTLYSFDNGWSAHVTVKGIEDATVSAFPTWLMDILGGKSNTPYNKDYYTDAAMIGRGDLHYNVKSDDEIIRHINNIRQRADAPVNEFVNDMLERVLRKRK